MHTFDTLSPVVHTKKDENAEGNDIVTLFLGLLFHLSTLETMRFQKAPLSKPFSKAFHFHQRLISLVSVLTIGEKASKSVIGNLSVF